MFLGILSKSIQKGALHFFREVGCHQNTLKDYCWRSVRQNCTWRGFGWTVKFITESVWARRSVWRDGMGKTTASFVFRGKCVWVGRWVMTMWMRFVIKRSLHISFHLGGENKSSLSLSLPLSLSLSIHLSIYLSTYLSFSWSHLRRLQKLFHVHDELMFMKLFMNQNDDFIYDNVMRDEVLLKLHILWVGWGIFRNNGGCQER